MNDRQQFLSCQKTFILTINWITGMDYFWRNMLAIMFNCGKIYILQYIRSGCSIIYKCPNFAWELNIDIQQQNCWWSNWSKDPKSIFVMSVWEKRVASVTHLKPSNYVDPATGISMIVNADRREETDETLWFFSPL